jgi:hypothetical protein
MVLGRIAHYAIDAILLSTVVAGVKRSTGFTCVLLPYYYVVRSREKPLFPFSLVSIQSTSPTLLSDHGLNNISALENQCSIPYKERQ